MKKCILSAVILFSIISLSFLCSAAIYNSTNTNIYECGNITENGTYIMNTSITGNDYVPQSIDTWDGIYTVCLHFLANDTYVDCNGSIITNNSQTIAMYGYSLKNITIRNCTMNMNNNNNGYGITFIRTSNSTFIYNKFNFSSYGVSLRFSPSSYNNISYNNCSFGDSCINLATSSYNNVNYNTANNISTVLRVSGGSYNRFNGNSGFNLVRGVLLGTSEYHDVFRNENYSGSGGGYLITQSNNISVYNSHFTSTSTSNKQVIDLYGINAYDINYINCTYNDSQLTILNSSLWFKKKWYVTLNITNSSSSYMNNSNVTFYQTNSSIETSVLTNASGTTTNALEITEYMASNISGEVNRGYYSNYTITVNLSGYGLNTFSKNISDNTLLSLQITDREAPAVSLISPSSAVSATSSSYDINFTFNVTDSNSLVSNCSIIISGTSYANTSSIVQNANNSIYVTGLTAGSYTAYASCTDTNNNIGNSSSVSITITAPSTNTASPGGGGGGGSVSGALTYTITEAQFAAGYTKDLGKGDKIKFSISNETHTFALNSLTDTQIEANVTSTLQQKTITLGTLAKFELNGDRVYDLSVKYEIYNTTSKKGKITLLKTSESMDTPLTPEAPVNPNENPAVQEQNKDSNALTISGTQEVNKAKSSFPVLLIIGIVLIAAIVVGVYFIKKRVLKKDK